jgi:multidrug efflux pump subunit AcrB
MILPMIDVPVSLLGTLAVMYLAGFTLNNLTLFGLVLAIGIVVDDAIVVLENVERWIAQGLNAREATLRAMSEITGPIIAITLVLSSVFIPSAFLGGVTGQFFRQFALTISVAIAISAINAMTLTPSRAAAIFRGHESGHFQTETLPRWGWAIAIGYGGYRLALAIFGRLPLLPETLPALAYNPADLQMWARWLVTHLMYMVPGIVIGWLVGPWLNTALRAFYRIFNRGFEKTAGGYTWLVGRLVRFAVVVLIAYVVLASLSITRLRGLRPAMCRHKTRAICSCRSNFPRLRRLNGRLSSCGRSIRLFATHPASIMRSPSPGSRLSSAPPVRISGRCSSFSNPSRIEKATARKMASPSWPG